MKKLTDYTLIEIVEKLKNKEVSSVDVVQASLDRIKETKDLNAILYFNEEIALAEARKSDERIAKGEARILEGVPIVVKDNISTMDYITSCGSKFLDGYIPPYDATVVKKLRDAGAVIVGKSNMDEFGMGSSGENSAYGKTLNPINNEYVTGGSSSGSAASVASNQCYAALGTETGGSVRQPSGFCGIVGLKPTYGRVSRYGVVAFGSSFDQVGPFTRTVRDNALMMDILRGHDELDGTSVVRNDALFSDGFVESIKGMKIGVAKEMFAQTMNEDVQKAMDETIAFYKEHGAEIVDISLPNIDKTLAVYYILTSAEAASNLSRFDGIKYTTRAKDYDGLVDMYYKSRTEGFGAEAKRRIMMGNYVLSASYYDAYYKKAASVRELLKTEFNDAFKKVDVIISPVSPTAAFKFGAKSSPMDMYLADIYTVPVNVVGVPAISFPVAKNNEGMPIACQLIANKWEESKLYALAEYYEKHKGGKN